MKSKSDRSELSGKPKATESPPGTGTGPARGIPASRNPNADFHQTTLEIARLVAGIARLIRSPEEAGIVLMHLDGAVASLADPSSSVPDAGEVTLRSVTASLQSQVAHATVLWEAEAGGVKVRETFSATSERRAVCDTIERNSFHELMLVIARLLLDPSDLGAMRENEVGALRCAPYFPAETARQLGRHRVAQALASRRFWNDVELGLERESALVAVGRSGHQRSLPGALLPVDVPVHSHSPRVDHESHVAPVITDASHAPVPEANMLVQEGKVWRIRYQGRESSLPDRVGFPYLQKLLSRPYAPVEVWELKGVARPDQSRQSIFDAQSLRAANQALQEVEELREEAERNNDEGGVARADEQLEQIRAGIPRQGSRPDRASMPDDGKRIRSAVARAITRAISEIGEICPEAGRHLDAAIQSREGLAPVYSPGAGTVWLVNSTTAGS